MEQKVEHVKITKDMTIASVVAKYPSCIETLMSFGVHCVGCHASYDETLEQGFMGHGMTEEEVDQAVAKLNETVEESLSASKEFLTVTEKAASKLKELMKSHNKEDYGLRIDVIPGGCSGFSYDFDFQKQAMPDDVVVEEKGVKVFINKEHEDFFRGSILEYVDSFQGAGFRIKNNNVKSTCGCGTSFN